MFASLYPPPPPRNPPPCNPCHYRHLAIFSVWLAPLLDTPSEKSAAPAPESRPVAGWIRNAWERIPDDQSLPATRSGAYSPKVWAKSARGVWGLGHVLHGKLYFAQEKCEGKWVPLQNLPQSALPNKQQAVLPPAEEAGGGPPGSSRFPEESIVLPNWQHNPLRSFTQCGLQIKHSALCRWMMGWGRPIIGTGRCPSAKRKDQGHCARCTTRQPFSPSLTPDAFLASRKITLDNGTRAASHVPRPHGQSPQNARRSSPCRGGGDSSVLGPPPQLTVGRRPLGGGGRRGVLGGAMGMGGGGAGVVGVLGPAESPPPPGVLPNLQEARSRPHLRFKFWCQH